MSTYKIQSIDENKVIYELTICDNIEHDKTEIGQFITVCEMFSDLVGFTKERFRHVVAESIDEERTQ